MFLFKCITFGNPPTPRAWSSFKEPVDTTDARLVLKNRCRDNMDSLVKSPASWEIAIRRAVSFSVVLTSLGSSSASNSRASTVKATNVKAKPCPAVTKMIIVGKRN